MSLSRDEIYHNWKFCALYQMMVLFPEESPFYSLLSLTDSITQLVQNKISFLWYGTHVSFEAVQKEKAKVTVDTCIEYLFDTCKMWFTQNEKTYTKDLGYDLKEKKRYFILSIDPIYIYEETLPEPSTVVPATPNEEKSNDIRIVLKSTYKPQNTCYSSFLLLRTSEPKGFQIVIDDYLSLYSHVYSWDSDQEVDYSTLLISVCFAYHYMGIFRPSYLQEPLKTIIKTTKTDNIKLVNVKSSKSLMMTIVDYLMSFNIAEQFRNPVLNIPNYRRVIKTPLDFNTIKTRVRNNYYLFYESFHHDILQLFKNCFTYNKISNPVYIEGAILKQIYLTIYKQLQELFKSRPDLAASSPMIPSTPSFHSYYPSKRPDYYYNDDSTSTVQYPIHIDDTNKHIVDQYKTYAKENREFAYIMKRRAVVKSDDSLESTQFLADKDDIVLIHETTEDDKYTVYYDGLFGTLPKELLTSDSPLLKLYKNEELKDVSIEVVEKGKVFENHIESKHEHPLSL